MALDPSEYDVDALPGSGTASGYAELFGPLVFLLGDADGDSAFIVKNADGDIIFKLDSSGNVFLAGDVYEASVIT